MSPPYGEGATTTQQPPPSTSTSNQQRQMSIPQAQMPGGLSGGNPQQQQQQQRPMGGPYGGFPQHQHLNGMNMGGGGNPNFINQGHRNSMPPPMNMGHQYNPNQGYNPNFNPQQGHPGQQQQPPPQYGHPQQQQQQQPQPQHGYPPQQHVGGMLPNQQQQQQQGMPPQQQQQLQPPPMGAQRPHPGNFHRNQRVAPPPQPQQYGQPPSYGRQPSNSNSQSGRSSANPSSGGHSSPGGGGPLNFNTAPNGAGVPGATNGPSGGGGAGGENGQQFLPSGLNGDWQSDSDMHHRREMIQHIVKLLKQKDKNASPEWLTKLPQMVKQLEVSLYRSASSFAAYSDTTTLKARLQQLAMEIAKKTQQAKDDAGRANDGAGRRGGGGGGSAQGGREGGQVRSSSHHHQNPSRNSFHNVSSNHSSSGNHVNDSGGADPVSSQHGNPNDPEWKIRIRHKQQRLLLLHHSSKCPYEDGECKVTPYCGEMKKLWKHMARCTDNECRVPHCFSSRSILSHYRKCKDSRCPACGPVRVTVRRGQQRHREERGGALPPGMGGDGLGIQSGGSQIQMPNEVSGGAVGGGNINYGISELMGSMQNASGSMQSGINALGGNPLIQQQGRSNNGAANGVNNLMVNGMMGGGPSQIGGKQHSPQMVNGMPVLHTGQNTGMGGGRGNNNNMGPQHPQMNPMGNGQQMPSLFPPGPLSNINAPQGVAPALPLPQSQANMNESSNGSNANPQHPVLPPPVPGSTNDLGTSVAPNNGAGSRNNKPEHDAKARHKRQRLLLLRHASKCTAETGRCVVTPHCAEMKVLWKHIANCKDSYCKVRHCMSSRYVLSHYRRCKPPCNICDPVKRIIKDGLNDPIPDDLDTDFERDGSRVGIGLAPCPPAPPREERKGERKTKKPRITPPSVPPVQPVPPSRINPPIIKSDPEQAPALQAPPSSTLGKDKPRKKIPEKPSSRQPSPKPPCPGEDHSLLECFTTEQIKTHIASLQKFAKLPTAELKGKCLEVLKGLQTHEHGWVFATPVNPVELGLDDYFDIIRKPMDLGTIQKKLDGGSYHSFDDFYSDVRLTFENAMKYNEEQTVVHEMAKELKKKFETDFKKLTKQMEKDHAENSKKVQACGLCGLEKLNFEPPVFFCNGPNCPTKRIRRNTHFYITADKQYAWCNQCFGELKGDTIELGTTKVTKSELTKRKNDEIHEESWVQCDDCKRWMHQICGLYNTRQDKDDSNAYSCPLCLLEKRQKGEDERVRQVDSMVKEALPQAPSAKDIPRTKLSDWLEKDVHAKVDARMRELSDEKADSENISYEEAYKALSAGGPLTIRQVTSTDRKHEVRDLMKARYAHKNYPDEFPYRCKCIVVFQNIDGVDVVLFALYVYEHGEDNPLPNKGTVYVSYLDSVHFMKPRQMRTFVYHEILISYLDYARDKGYQQAFIWACPPLKGDDYIFYAKPEDQKTPKDVRLRQWYLDMLKICQKRNIVGKVTNMHDQYFTDESLDAAAVPYFEGDYFPGEAENIIKNLNDESAKRAAGVEKKKSSSKSKKSADVINSDVDPEKTYEDGGRDPVMQKFCDAISGMKESFIVAFLNCEKAKPENLIVPKEITEYREKHKELGNVKIEGGNQSKKRDINGNEIVAGSDEKQVDRLGRPIRVLDDDTEEIDCEFFNTRQCFLDLCRGNHYQFDELRRSKHTSMMVLWHLQNREAPKFVQQCASCAREISSGVRHHCNTCPDFDLCHDCYQDPNANRGQCTHNLETIKVDTGSSQSNGLTEEQRKERQRNIQLHIALIEHASRCTSPKCKSANCQKMKSYLKHGTTCKIKASGGCKICKRIWTLLRIHAQQCKSSKCPIPQCIAIRKRIRQLQLKQRAMDDRRRQEMNRHYRMGTMSS